MVTITTKNETVTLSFPANYVSKKELDRFVDYLRFAELASKVNFPEQEIEAWAKEVKSSWFKEHKQELLQKIGL